MIYAVLSAAMVITVAIYFFSRTNRYYSFAVLTLTGAKCDRVIKLPLLSRTQQKLNAEIKIFNRMNVVMPAVRGIPIYYIDSFRKLVDNPRWIPASEDPYQRLIYLYAAANLSDLTRDALTKRQLFKNSSYVFARTQRKKILQNTRLSKLQLFAHRQPQFKFLLGQAVSKTVSDNFEVIRDKAAIPLKMRCSPSYANFIGDCVKIKTYADATLPVECFEINSPLMFSFFAAPEKFNFALSHTTDTFFYVDERTGAAVGIYASGFADTTRPKPSFGSSLAEKTDDLKIYIENAEKIFVVRGKSKAAVTATIAEIKRRGNKLDYLRTPTQIAEITQLEDLLSRAHNARLVNGEDLKNRFAATSRLVPALHLPTLVYKIENAAEFFAVVDSFSLYEKLNTNLNIVLLYSSLNDNIREIINSFIDQNAARSLIEKGIFLFFIDRIRTSNEAVYYLSRMHEAQYQTVTAEAPSTNGVTVSVKLGKTFPLTYTVTAINTLSKGTTAAITVPIQIGTLSAMSRKDSIVRVTNLRTGHSSTYKLPAGAKTNTYLDKGRETVAQKLYVTVTAKLAAFEEKTFKIIKNESSLSAKERKSAFLDSLTDIKITAGNKDLTHIFSLPIDAPDESFVKLLKTAISNHDPRLFYALFLKRGAVPADAWAVIIEKIIGIKLIKGSVQLAPKTLFTGNFTLSFTHNNTPYQFNVKERGQGFTVMHGAQEYRNFLQVNVAANK